jgi:hypothetical protein
MRIFAILSWYDESPSWLAATVASLAKCADHVIAVDGAYALYPDAQARSHFDQAQAIQLAAEAAGLGLTLYQPAEPFAGNEVEKRTLSLRLAQTLATPYEDWYVIVDGDEVVLECASDFRERLAATDKLVATYGLTEYMEDPYTDEAREQFARVAYVEPTWTVQLRSIYRALPGLRYEGAHFVVTAEHEGRQRYLFGLTPHHGLEPAEEMHHCLRIEHRNRQRHRARQAAAKQYYANRDSTNIEALSTVFMESPTGDLLEVA